MTDPIIFAATTPRHKLPNLFPAQAQKEFTVNEAHARLDMLLHPAVEGEANIPPVAPTEGEMWLIGDSPAGDWTMHSGEIASWQSGNWLFVIPKAGMSVFDRSAGAVARFDEGWVHATRVPQPDGGATQDVEARAAISGLIAALVCAGILPEN